MLSVCWSVKGGTGTSVFAASLALELARHEPVTLVDLAGDLPCVLGVPAPLGPPPMSAYASSPFATPVSGTSLRLVPRSGAAARVDVLVDTIVDASPTVVVDAGVVTEDDTPSAAVLARADRSLLVLRPCYLAVRRACASRHRAHGIVLVVEPGRSLTAHDVEAVVGVPVVAEIPFDPAIARAVDAGLLATRMPLSLRAPLVRCA